MSILPVNLGAKRGAPRRPVAARLLLEWADRFDALLEATGMSSQDLAEQLLCSAIAQAEQEWADRESRKARK